MAKIAHEKWKVYQNVFDNYTLRLLFVLSSQGHFDELKSPISVGKEANVFSATTKDKKLVAIKIYRLEACNFNKMYDYIKYDERFPNMRKQRRKVIFSWVQREFRNMFAAREAGARVPLPIKQKDHVIIMDYIGNGDPSPQLKDSPPKNQAKFSDEIIHFVKLMYQKGLTHGDLSEYNILNHNGKPVLIDFSQGTIRKSINFNELFERDVKNIVRYFNKIGLKKDYDKTIKEITRE